MGGNRVAAVLVGCALLLLAAWWIIGSTGGSQQGAAPALVQVSATEFGTGSWARYSVSLKNAGDVPFTGSVILLAGESAVTTGGVSGVPNRLPNAVPQLPASAPDAGYEVPVSLAAHQLRTVAIAAPDHYVVVAVAREPDGGLVASAPVDHSPAVAVAALTGSQAVVDQVGGARFDNLALHVTQFSDARAFPASALGLAGFVALVVDQFDAGTLSPAQRQAIADFVAQGGALITAGGRGWRQTLGSLPPDLAGLRPLSSGTASLAPVLSLSGRPAQPVADIAISDSPAARVTVASSDGIPLVAAAERGQGIVIGLAFDPAAMPVADGSAAAGWSVALGPALSRTPGAPPAARTMPAVDAATALAVPPPPGAGLPSPWLVGPLVAAYLLVVAPLNYVVLRRRGRPDRFWMTAPLIAGAFAAAFYGLGAALQAGVQDSELQVLKIAPGSVAAVEYHRVLFTHRGDHAVTLTVPALAAPLTDQLALTGCGDRCGLDLTGLRSGQEHVVPAQQPGVIEKGVVYGGERVFGATYTSHLPVGLDANLALQGGRVTGEIKNAGGRTVSDLAVYVALNGQVQQMPVPGVLEPGRLVSIDGQLRSVPTAETSDTAARVRRQLGGDMSRLSGGAWIVGSIAGLPSPVRVDGQRAPAAVTTVFEQQVPMASGSGLLAGLAPTRLVGSAGERTQGGFTNVYDLEVPSGSGQLGVAYQAALYGAGVEVYDWSTGGWRRAGFTDDPSGSGLLRSLLTSGEVSAAAGGQQAAVRVRVAEPRIGWGSGISLFRP